jgi:hypothetical protein
MQLAPTTTNLCVRSFIDRFVDEVGNPMLAWPPTYEIPIVTAFFRRFPLKESIRFGRESA